MVKISLSRIWSLMGLRFDTCARFLKHCNSNFLLFVTAHLFPCQCIIGFENVYPRVKMHYGTYSLAWQQYCKIKIWLNVSRSLSVKYLLHTLSLGASRIALILLTFYMLKWSVYHMKIVLLDVNSTIYIILVWQVSTCCLVDIDCKTIVLSWAACI